MTDVQNTTGSSDKSRTVAAVLCFFLGALGVHSFYAGKIVVGIIQLLTLGGLGIWALIDFIFIVIGKYKDKNGGVISEW